MQDDVPGPDVAPEARWIEVGGDRRRIAVRARAAAPGATGRPGLFWLGGFHSDMQGTKAVALDAFAARVGRACTRFDYSGHGESDGEFADGTIGRWLEDALAVFERCTAGPQILVGSSMGGWLALLLARTLARRGERQRLAAMVLIAPAPDFTEELMWKAMSDEARTEIMQRGYWMRSSAYEAPYPITRALIEDGRDHLVMGASIETGCPVRILQGARDEDVPWQHAFALTALLPAEDVVFTLIQDGDHRLSREADIARLIKTIEEF